MPLKPLAEYLPKDDLLNMGEDMVKKVYMDVLKPLIVQIIKDTDNKYDDLILPFIDELDKVVLPAIDKIDGQEG